MLLTCEHVWNHARPQQAVGYLIPSRDLDPHPLQSRGCGGRTEPVQRLVVLIDPDASLAQVTSALN